MASQEGYTPGPWVWRPFGETIAIDALKATDGWGVAHINPAGNSNAGIPSRRNRANAALISAAPEMAEIVVSFESLAGFMSNDMSLPSMERQAFKRALARCRAVLKKAGR